MSRFQMPQTFQPPSPQPKSGTVSPPEPNAGSPSPASSQQGKPISSQQEPQSQQQPQSDPFAKLSETLTQVVNNSNDSKLMAQIAQDPELSAILRARQTGQKVRIVTDDDPGPGPQQQQKPLEEMDDQEKTTYLLSQVDVLANKRVKEQLTPLTREIEQLRNYAQTNEQRQAAAQLASAKQKYSDFEEVLPTIQQLIKEGYAGPNANAEQLYHMACGVMQRSPKFNQQMQSELPTHSNARPPLKELRKTPLPPGRSGFQQALQESLARMDFHGSDDVET
jgi:DNA repair exonuclease SbcCD ATPase subunit